MLEAPHVLVGVAIATKFPHPALAIPLAIGSHIVLDMLPHWNPHLNTEMKTHGRVSNQSKAVIYVDLAVSLAAIGFFSYQALPNMSHAILIGATGFASMVPDLVEAPYFFFKWKTRLLERWILFQKAIQTDAGPVFGILTQIVVSFAALWWILN